MRLKAPRRKLCCFRVIQLLNQPLFGHSFPEHGISGDVLVKLDQDTLKEVGVASLGQRLAILKAVYHLKIANHIDIEPDHYIPPCQFSFIFVCHSKDLTQYLHSRSGREY